MSSKEKATGEKAAWTDYSIASPLERLANSVEHALRSWRASASTAEALAEQRPDGDSVDDLGGGAKLVRETKEMSIDGVSFELVYCWNDRLGAPSAAPSLRGTDNDGAPLTDDFPADAHHLQRWFGIRHFVLLSPLDGAEVRDVSHGAKLLSALCIAAQYCQCPVPLFVPIAELWRGAYIGYARSDTGGTHYETAAAARVAAQFHYLSGIVDMHNRRIGFVPLDGTKQRIAAKLTYDVSMPEGIVWRRRANVRAAVRTSTDNDADETDGVLEENFWGPSEDPVASVHIMTIWHEFGVDELGDHEYGSDLKAAAAPEWRLRAVFRTEGRTLLAEGIGDLLAACRHASQLDSLHDLFEAAHGDKRDARDAVERLVAATGGAGGAIQTTLNAVDAGIGGDRSGVRGRTTEATKRLVQSTVRGTMKTLEVVGAVTQRLAERLRNETLPDGRRIQELLRRVFDEPLRVHEHSLPRAALKGAPPTSLLASFVRTALSLTSLRAVALLWQAFLLEIRWHWEHALSLPLTELADTIDLSNCIVHQKLEMLAYCIAASRKRKKTSNDATSSTTKEALPPRLAVVADTATDEALFDANDDDEGENGWDDFDLDFNEADEEKEAPATNENGGKTSSGDATVHSDDAASEVEASNARGREARLDFDLLGTKRRAYRPATLDVGVWTEDMADERQSLLSLMGSGAEAQEQRTKMQSAQLLSDMRAFKAANPGCCLVDFVRWHSPNDVVEDGTKLSARMGGGADDATDNIWQTLWKQATPLESAEQPPLFHCEREANKVLHYLETLAPVELFAQIFVVALDLCVSVVAAEEAESDRHVLQNTLVMRDVHEAASSMRDGIDAFVGGADFRTVDAAADAGPMRVQRTLLAEHLCEADDENVSHMLSSIAHFENVAARAVSLHAKLPQNAELVSALLGGAECHADASARASLTELAHRVAPSQEALSAPRWREFVVRTTAFRPHYHVDVDLCDDADGAPVHRSYSISGEDEFRFAWCASIID